MWGIIPAAGAGSRIQPLAFSKELLPVGSRPVDGVERPVAVSEYILERMIRAGADRICFVVSPGKTDIIEYFGEGSAGASICYVVQPEPAGLCDALFRALPLVGPGEHALVGLPDTVWFPEDGLCALGDGPLSFLLFEVERPWLFDAVVLDGDGAVTEVLVKDPGAPTPWVWGAFRLSGKALAALHALWVWRGKKDEFIGTLVNAWLKSGGWACGVHASGPYFDVGTMDGYREAARALEGGSALPLAEEGLRGKAPEPSTGERRRASR